jgi:alkaline phosphatase D
MKVVCILITASLAMTTTGGGAIDHEHSTGAIHINSLHTIAFGSCYNTQHGGGIWRLIDSFDPDHLVLLGDNIYADKIVGHFDDNTPMVIEEEYRQLSQMPEFQTLLSHVVDWSLTYDDHDYGVNNADKTFPHRNISQLLFWDFARTSFKDSVDPRSRSGVYSSKTIRIPTAATAVDERRDFMYKTVLLDSRYHLLCNS